MTGYSVSGTMPQQVSGVDARATSQKRGKAGF
jgi:hypothetical protein